MNLKVLSDILKFHSLCIFTEVGGRAQIGHTHIYRELNVGRMKIVILLILSAGWLTVCNAEEESEKLLSLRKNSMYDMLMLIYDPHVPPTTTDAPARRVMT